jgi:hypothetical protein
VALSRVGLVLVVLVVGFLIARAYAKPGAARIPAGCHQVDYGRDAYVDCP